MSRAERQPSLANRSAEDSENRDIGLLAQLLSACPYPALLARRRDGRIVACNGRFAEKLGAAPSELHERFVGDLVTCSTVRAEMAEALASGSALVDRSVTLVGPAGRAWLAELNAEVLPCCSHDFCLCSFAGRSGSAALPVDAAAVGEGSTLRFELDAEGVVLVVSEETAERLGYATDQLLGKPLQTWIHRDDVPKLKEDPSDPRGGRALELRLRHRDGSTHRFSAVRSRALDSATVVLAGRLHPTRPPARIAAGDEWESVNRCLKEARHQLLETEKLASLGSLMAGIAHEIRTPMGAVSSTHSTLQRALERLRTHLLEHHPEVAGDRKVMQLLEVAKNATRVVGDGSTRVREMVRRLGSYSCADVNTACRVNINSIVVDTLALLHHELKHHITVEKHLAPEAQVLGYPGRLNQVLVNLLVNAAHAVKAKGGGTITIMTRSDPDHVDIAIADTGIGIPEENLAKVFDSGFTTKGAEGGSGIGLAISNDIVRDHGGTLSVESTPGRGTTFQIRLPRDMGGCAP